MQDCNEFFDQNRYGVRSNGYDILIRTKYEFIWLYDKIGTFISTSLLSLSINPQSLSRLAKICLISTKVE